MNNAINYQIPESPLDFANDITKRICIFGYSDQIYLSADAVDMIKESAGAHADQMKSSSSHYKSMRNATKAREDIYKGKCGEYVGSAFFADKNFPEVKPDVKIYAVKDKTFSPDLFFGKVDKRFPDCGVKTCTEDTLDFMERSTGERQKTWTFQLNDVDKRNGRDSLFKKTGSSEPILFVYVDDTLCSAEVVASAPWAKVYPLLRDPVSPRLKGIKKCLYMNDLVEANNRQ